MNVDLLWTLQDWLRGGGGRADSRRLALPGVEL